MDKQTRRSFKFSTNARITRDKEIESILHSGTYVREQFLTIAWTARTDEKKSASPRLAIRIPSKIAHAVHRNRIKRLLREIFRREQWDIKQNTDLVVLVRPFEQWDTIGYSDLKQLFLNLCKKTGILKNEIYID